MMDERIWLDAPLPALRVRRIDGDLEVRPNAAALHWAEGAGVDSAALQALGQLAQASGALAGDLPLGGVQVQCVPVPMDEGVLLWLKPLAPVLPAHAASPVSLTQMAAEALAIGFWNRDIDARGWHWDARMFEIHDWPSADAPPTPAQWLAECVHPDDRAWLNHRVRDADLQGLVRQDTEFRIVDRSGATRWVQACAWRLQRGGRRLSCGMHIDITERRAAEVRNEQTQRLLAAGSERLAQLAHLGHALREPAQTVLGLTRLIEADGAASADERQRERLRRVGEAAARVGAVADRLLALSDSDIETVALDTAPTLHVLCIEDNPVNLQLVRELIALRPQVRLSTAVDGLSGVDAALAEPPDLLLLDLQLPDIDGREVMRRLRAEPRMAGCRIVALSADAMPDHIADALAAGFDDYWTKPIQFDAFLGHLDTMAARAAS